MSARSLFLPDQVQDYLVRHAVRDTPAQRALRAETLKLPSSNMQISAEQGQLMQLLVRLIGARRCIEIGTYTGYSALCVALALPPEGRIVCCDLSEEWTAIGRRYWQQAGVCAKIDLRIAPALQTLDALLAAGEAGGYDFAFIDADKQNYDGYYERCLQLVRPGGLITLDNTLWSGRVADPAAGDADTQALRALNAKLHGDARVELSMVPIGDGFSIALKRDATESR